MSLYNALFGANLYAKALLLLLGEPLVPRFRDCYLNEKDEIVIFCRTGGGNREAYRAGNASLTKLPGYLRDKDCEFDSTFAEFFYAPRAEDADIIAEIKEKQGKYDPMGSFRELLADLNSGKDTPGTRRALDVGKSLIGKIEKAAAGNGPTIITIED